MVLSKMIPLRPTSRRSRTSRCIPTDRLSRRSPYNRTDNLRCTGILDLLDLADDRLIDSCANGA